MAYTMSINLNESTFADLAVFIDAALENGADLDDGLLLNDGQLTVEIDTTLIAVEEDEFEELSGFGGIEDLEDLEDFQDDENYGGTFGYDDFTDSARGTNMGGGNAMPGMSAAKESLREFFNPRDGFPPSAQSAGSAQSLRKWSEFGRNILQDLGREVENLSRDLQDRGADGGARGAFGDFNPADFDERLNQANYGDSADRGGDAVDLNGEDVDNRGNFGESVEKPGEEGKESDSK